MREQLQFYIDGRWIDPVGPVRVHEVVNPATEEVAGRIALGSAADVDIAAKAARRAFASYSRTSREERIALLERIFALYAARLAEIAAAITEEMGAPPWLAQRLQAPSGAAHFKTALDALKSYEFEAPIGSAGTRVVKEPVGVVGMITPWNWPANQVACKVAPALAAGCTMILKPSELAPFDSLILAEILHEAGVPAGVFNLVNGDGAGVGQALATHPEIDMVSFTGSTRAGVSVAKAAADTVKRVHQELGGKSPNIVLPDADFAKAVAAGVKSCFGNSGQSCNAPTRMLVPAERLEEAERIAAETVAKIRLALDPASGEQPGSLGPLANAGQFAKVTGMVEDAIAAGARVVAGGAGRPEGVARGYFVRPTVLSGVDNQAAIAREEVFGPVLVLLAYRDEADAIRIANDTPYGLSAYVQSADLDHARRVAGQLRAGMVHINGAPTDNAAPFGGYKQSGNGREWGALGLAEFLEVKAVMGFTSSA